MVKIYFLFIDSTVYNYNLTIILNWIFKFLSFLFFFFYPLSMHKKPSELENKININFFFIHYTIIEKRICQICSFFSFLLYYYVFKIIYLSWYYLHHHHHFSHPFLQVIPQTHNCSYPNPSSSHFTNFK